MKNLVGIPPWLKSIVVTALLIALMLLLAFIFKFGFTPSEDQGAWGQFGDFVGGILNPLFSIIGLLALLYTIVLQSDELRRSTKELKSSARALKRQNRHNARQQFDNNFFQLLTLSIAHSNSLSYGFGSSKKSGGSAFVSAFNDFRHGWNLNKATGNEWIERFDDWHAEGGTDFDAYAHSITNIIDFVYEADVPQKAKNFAYSTISSNITRDQAVIYFLIVVFSDDHNWFRDVLVEVDFFSNCPSGRIRFDLVLGFIGDFYRIPDRS